MMRDSARCVVLYHHGIAEPHFDIMIETMPNSPLATWRSAVWPILKETELTRLPDHRPAYLYYEGPVSGDRGSVRRVFAGLCVIDDRSFRMAEFVIAQFGERWIATPVC